MIKGERSKLELLNDSADYNKEELDKILKKYQNLKQLSILPNSYIKRAVYTYIEESAPPKYQVELTSDFITTDGIIEEGIISFITSNPWKHNTFNDNNNTLWTLTINSKERKEEVELDLNK